MDANPIHEANRHGWDAASPGWQAMIEREVDWRGCPGDPTIALDPRELDLLGDVSGLDACVLGSGDNLVVFALAGMGAKVTSVDISQVQLDTATARVEELGLDVSFLRADVTDLGALEDESFDLVYTGGHVAVWVSDLEKYYSEACRVLRRGGVFMVSEYHPFRRIWRETCCGEAADGATPGPLEVKRPYFDRGPHEYDRSENVPGTPAGSLPSYEFHWTVSDYVSALMKAGCELLAMDEFGDGLQRWEMAPMTGLPYYLLLKGRRR